MKKVAVLFTIGVFMVSSVTVHAAKENWKQQFEKVSDEYFDQVYFHYAPTQGTQVGYHQYDTQLEDYSPKNIDAEIAALKKYEKRIEAIHPYSAASDLVPRSDREIMLANIRSQLLTLETIRPWEKNADEYSSTCANGAFVLMERKFASPDERLRSLVAREKQMPAVLAEARVNLKNPPRVFTEIAIEQLPGIVSFFEHDVPLAFADAKDEALKAEFAETNAAVISALKSYLDWLKTNLLAKSNGDFRIGAETFAKKLQYDEMVDLPLDKLLEIGWADLRRNQEHFRQVAAELEPGKDPRAVLDELGKDHPAPDQLIPTFRATFDSLIGFIREHRIVTIPSEVRPVVEESPPFMRATTTASMDTPGAFETHTTEAYFNVTLPDASMTPAEVDGYMHGFNVGTVI
ncbi:MAG: DUF885 domain-containing protein, partial [Terracidiphilus sp.]